MNSNFIHPFYSDVFYLPFSDKLIITTSYLFSTVLSYALMLVVMTFNGGLFIAAVGGLTLGYLVFGYMRKTEVKETGEKCCSTDEF